MELTRRKSTIPGTQMITSMNEYIGAYIYANALGAGQLLHERFTKHIGEMNEKVASAETLKRSLETPYEMPDDDDPEWSDRPDTCECNGRALPLSRDCVVNFSMRCECVSYVRKYLKYVVWLLQNTKT
jgi:hypothetical protein